LTALEVRVPREDELERARRAAEAAFGSSFEDEWWEPAKKVMPLDRTLTALDDGNPVALAAAYPFSLTIPGGELPCGGVTWVGVSPSHRRRGVLRALMRRQIDDLHERGEPLAALWATESVIYGRFGYGIAAPVHRLDAAKAGFGFRGDPKPVGSVRLIDEAEARDAFPPIYERVRAERAGMLARGETWWNEFRLPDRHPPGLGPRFYALYEDAGYAIYRVKSKWEHGIPNATALAVEVLGATGVAERELWRFLFSLDLASTVESEAVDPSGPLFLGTRDPRRLRLSLNDGLWLRLVDVDAALRARSFATEESVVVEVRDMFCPWNTGRYRLGVDAGRSDDAPELALDVSDLASVYLGGVDLYALAAAGFVDELRAGAVARAARLLVTLRAPFCPEVF
jgi:predicted acetyltransferase